MNVVPVVIFLLVVGVVLYLLRARMDETIRNIVIAVLVFLVAMWLLSIFGIITLPAALQIGGKHG